MAGFIVIGVDNRPQPRYVGDGFILADVLVILQRLIDGEGVEDDRGRVWHLDDFDLIHASPPCQKYGKTKHLSGDHPRLIGDTRCLLIQSGCHYVIENVPGAPLINPLMLTAAMYGMLIKRDRLFECSFDVPFQLSPTAIAPVKMGRPVGEGDVLQPVGHFSNVAYARQQMGLDWMDQHGLSQAIPPVYTEYIGRQMLAALAQEVKV